MPSDFAILDELRLSSLLNGRGTLPWLALAFALVSIAMLSSLLRSITTDYPYGTGSLRPLPSETLYTIANRSPAPGHAGMHNVKSRLGSKTPYAYRLLRPSDPTRIHTAAEYYAAADTGDLGMQSTNDALTHFSTPSLKHCRPIHVSAVVRHGTRSLSSQKPILAMRRFIRQFGSHLTPEQRSSLLTWVGTFRAETIGHLTEEGHKELRDQGYRLVLRYPDLFTLKERPPPSPRKALNASWEQADSPAAGPLILVENTWKIRTQQSRDSYIRGMNDALELLTTYNTTDELDNGSNRTKPKLQAQVYLQDIPGSACSGVCGGAREIWKTLWQQRARILQRQQKNTKRSDEALQLDNAIKNEDEDEDEDELDDEDEDESFFKPDIANLQSLNISNSSTLNQTILDHTTNGKPNPSCAQAVSTMDERICRWGQARLRFFSQCSDYLRYKKRKPWKAILSKHITRHYSKTSLAGKLTNSLLGGRAFEAMLKKARKKSAEKAQKVWLKMQQEKQQEEHRLQTKGESKTASPPKELPAPSELLKDTTTALEAKAIFKFVANLWQLCAAQVTGGPEGLESTEWCSIFLANNYELLRDMERIQDVKSYCKKGPYNRLTYSASCPLLNSLFGSANLAVQRYSLTPPALRSGGPTYYATTGNDTTLARKVPVASLYFAHAETLAPLLVLLGIEGLHFAPNKVAEQANAIRRGLRGQLIWQDERELEAALEQKSLADQLAGSQNPFGPVRGWRMGASVPMGANLHMITYECEASGTRKDAASNMQKVYMAQLMHNEEPVPWPIGLCNEAAPIKPPAIGPDLSPTEKAGGETGERTDETGQVSTVPYLCKLNTVEKFYSSRVFHLGMGDCGEFAWRRGCGMPYKFEF